jgi:hypothetical protein
MKGSAPSRQNLRLPASLPDLLTLKTSRPFRKPPIQQEFAGRQAPIITCISEACAARGMFEHP